MNVMIEGVGSIGNKHINALRRLAPSSTIYCLRSSTQSTSHPGLVNIYSYNELPVKPDFVIISNPTQYHRNSILKALSLKVPIMVEKPVMHNISDEDNQIREYLKGNSLQTYVACNLRFLDVLIFLKRHIVRNSDRVNEVNIYCGSYFPDWRPNRNYKDVYSAKNQEGGGIHLELIHELDYACWLFGLPKLKSWTTASKSSIDIESYDYAHYVLEYPDFIATVTLNFYRRDAKRGLEIVFEDKTWFVDLINSNIMDNKQQNIFKSNQRISDTYDLQMKHMLNVVSGKESSINTILDSMEILKLCLGDGRAN
jgi:predicted dehydrogenase